MTRLSVNLNKIALLRNSRRTGVPDVAAFVDLAREAGADGITIHPRPDERHIRAADVDAIAARMAAHRPRFELNIEGYPDPRLLALVASVRPEQCTLVPDAADAFTSERGWRFDAAECAVLAPALEALRAIGTRIVLFVDPDPDAVARACAGPVEGVEIYTGAYAAAAARGDARDALAAAAAAARAAVERGRVVNIGHDLDLPNLPALIRALPPVREASIGHALTADALVHGFAGAIERYRGALAPDGPAAA